MPEETAPQHASENTYALSTRGIVTRTPRARYESLRCCFDPDHLLMAHALYEEYGAFARRRQPATEVGSCLFHVRRTVLRRHNHTNAEEQRLRYPIEKRRCRRCRHTPCEMRRGVRAQVAGSYIRL